MSITIQIFALLLCLCLASCKQDEEADKKPAETPGLPQVDDSPSFGAVSDLFSTKCASCHNGKESTLKIDFSKVESLIKSDLIAPFDQDNSMILVKIKQGHGGLAEGDIQTITNWIDWSIGLGAETHLAQNSKAAIDAVRQDLEKHASEDRKFLKYISLHEYVSRYVKRIETPLAVKGMVKGINLLSQAEDILDSVVIDKDRGVVRVNLQAVGWPISEWERATKEYPYLYESEALKDACVDCGVVIVRAGWFLDNALRAPTYYRLAGIPRQLDLFENHIGVNFAQSITDGHTIRAGFKESGVAEHNRIIERYNNAPKFVWRSYEFNSNVGTENVLENPFGPGTQTAGGRIFDHKGSEFIYQRKNGLFGFYAVASGKEAVNATPSLPVRGVRTTISVGLTCLQCHKTLISRRDETREHLASALGVQQLHLNKLATLYPTFDVMAAKMAEDNESQAAALAKIGLNVDVRDPIFDIIDTSKKVDFNLLAFELGIPLRTIVEKSYALKTQNMPAAGSGPAPSIRDLSDATSTAPNATNFLRIIIRNAFADGNRMSREKLDELLFFQRQLVISELK